MKSKKKNVIIDKIVIVVSKITEIIHWIGAVSMVALSFMPLFAKDRLAELLNKIFLEDGILQLNTYGFELNAANADGTPNFTLFVLFTITSAIILSLFAMLFRNIYLIFKKINSSEYSSSNSPFQPDIVRMVREIGIFEITYCAIGFLMSIIISLIVSPGSAECVFPVSGIIIGLIILCLSRVFSYGSRLENDVDGLL